MDRLIGLVGPASMGRMAPPLPIYFGQGMFSRIGGGSRDAGIIPMFLLRVAAVGRRRPGAALRRGAALPAAASTPGGAPFKLAVVAGGRLTRPV